MQYLNVPDQNISILEIIKLHQFKKKKIES